MTIKRCKTTATIAKSQNPELCHCSVFRLHYHAQAHSPSRFVTRICDSWQQAASMNPLVAAVFATKAKLRQKIEQQQHDMAKTIPKRTQKPKRRKDEIDSCCFHSNLKSRGFSVEKDEQGQAGILFETN
ncbi:unnamed protein product [Ceratitis capitata]|uniref:(Mediterranean fruit fly) hypothetical protein n=1 Tax=Ceratitis capitata TaxID=7213 RepID=A0A811U090_CERCA|nr:unnamed protein product [Ceratitis capitata]